MGLVQLDTHVGLEINPALFYNLETIPTSILGPKLGLSILFVIFKSFMKFWPRLIMTFDNYSFPKLIGAYMIVNYLLLIYKIVSLLVL